MADFERDGWTIASIKFETYGRRKKIKAHMIKGDDAQWPAVDMPDNVEEMTISGIISLLWKEKDKMSS